MGTRLLHDMRHAVAVEKPSRPTPPGQQLVFAGQKESSSHLTGVTMSGESPRLCPEEGRTRHARARRAMPVDVGGDIVSAGTSLVLLKSLACLLALILK